MNFWKKILIGLGIILMAGDVMAMVSLPNLLKIFAGILIITEVVKQGRVKVTEKKNKNNEIEKIEE